MNMLIGIALLFILAFRLKSLINPFSAGYWWKMKELNILFASVAISMCIFLLSIFLLHPYLTYVVLWLLLIELYWTYKFEKSAICCESEALNLKKFESIEKLRNARQAYIVCLVDTTDLDEIICLISSMPESSPVFDELKKLTLDYINIEQMLKRDRVSNKESLVSLIKSLKLII